MTRFECVLQAYQGGDGIVTIEKRSEGEFFFSPKKKDDVVVCWRRLDSNEKTVNFVIYQQVHDPYNKATAETIEDVGAQIENLQFKLDEISMFVSTQVDTEKLHFESK